MYTLKCFKWRHFYESVKSRTVLGFITIFTFKIPQSASQMNSLEINKDTDVVGNDLKGSRKMQRYYSFFS